MLLGMGLMKLGVFAAERSRSFYAWMAALGYGIGLPLMILDATELIRHEFKDDYMLQGGIFYNAFGSLVVALGHVGLIMLIVQSGALTWLTRRLAAVGRMALSNYLTHSIVCTTLFYGYGFGLFGQINRTGLAAIVLTIWVVQLWISPIWLKHFRFGPAEWLWRSLTYWRIQPMKLSARRGMNERRPRPSAFSMRPQTLYTLGADRFSIKRGEKADQFRIGLDSDPLVHAVDPLQVVRAESQWQKAVNVRGDRGVVPRVRRGHRKSWGDDGIPVDLGDRPLEEPETVGVDRRDPRGF